MKYFIKGSSHFFNLFADFLEHCEKMIYLILLLILFVLIIATFKQVKNSLKDIVKSFFGLFKYIPFTFAFILLLVSVVLTYKINNQFKVLSLLVTTINFLIELINIYDNQLLIKKENKKIFKWKDFRNILLPNLILIFFKFTYWGELYMFDSILVKKYIIVMLVIIFLQLIVMMFFKLYSIYSIVFQFLKTKNNYQTLNKVKDLITIFSFSNNNVNHFRITKVYLQKEIITKENRKDIISFNYFYKSFSKKVKCKENIYEYNLELYREFKNISDRIESDFDE